MDIVWADDRLRELCLDLKKRRKKWGPASADVIGRRLDDMHAAESLAVLGRLRSARCHELKGDRAGQLAVDAGGALRIVFLPAKAPRPEKPDGGLDWAKVDAVRILEVGDYHD